MKIETSTLPAISFLRSKIAALEDKAILLRAHLDTRKSDGMSDGMQTMTHRTTFALDETTAHRLKRLSARWQVSQAEVVRRSLEQAEKLTESQKPDAIALLRRLHEKGGGLNRAKADAYLAEVHEDRKHWRGE